MPLKILLVQIIKKHIKFNDKTISNNNVQRRIKLEIIRNFIKIYKILILFFIQKNLIFKKNLKYIIFFFIVFSLIFINANN